MGGGKRERETERAEWVKRDLTITIFILVEPSKRFYDTAGNKLQSDPQRETKSEPRGVVGGGGWNEGREGGILERQKEAQRERE